MRNKFCLFLITAIFLAGCATSGKAFTYVKSKKYGNGYVINRKGVIIPEYTVGRDNQAPEDLELAQARFKKRKGAVDSFYKRMGVIVDSNVEMGKTMGSFVTAPFRAPFKIADYNRYENDPDYRAEVDRAEELADQKEEERIAEVRKELAAWLAEQIKREEAGSK